MLDPAQYAIDNLETLQTPALIYYRDIIIENTQKAIDRVGQASQLWPHVKSHKMAEMIRMQQSMGISRFKCATIAEAQMVAECGAAHILLAYPLVGPNIERFVALHRQYPQTQFYAIGDDETQLQLLSAAMQASGLCAKTLLDVNMGMNRTGVPLKELEALYSRCATLEGLSLVGLHCYDGHIHDPSLQTRVQNAQPAIDRVYTIRQSLLDDGFACHLLVMGGTPTFPVHAPQPDAYLSPGTIFLGDAKCLRDVPDLDITPAAGIMTRVISHPADGLFTLDLGSKGISTDQPERGMLVGCHGAIPLFQSEEHWVFQMPEGLPVPPIGTVLFVIPMHICPTTALYPFAHVVSDRRIIDQWEVTARNRSIGI